jgi:hypothetical protein
MSNQRKAEFVNGIFVFKGKVMAKFCQNRDLYRKV